MRTSLSVVLPAYNAAGCVADSVRRLREGLGGEGGGGTGAATATGAAGPEISDLEIIVVDDGSRDGTAELARQAKADQVIVLERNQGKGAAVRAGMLAANSEVVIFTDVDLSYGPVEICRLVAALDGDVQVSVGVRAPNQDRSSGWLRWLGSSLVGLMARAFLRFSTQQRAVRDTQCGIKAFSRASARRLFSAARINRFAFDIELFYLMSRWDMAFVAVEVAPEANASSTVRILRDGMRTLADVVRIARYERAGVYAGGSGAAPSGSGTAPGGSGATAATSALDAIVKSYDIRGKVPSQLNEDLAAQLGRGFVEFWRQDDPGATRILCGQDMRHSSPALSLSFMQAVAAGGFEVVDLGLISTDMLYFASASLDAPGVMFTASHNPAEYNGIKACRRQAVPVGFDTGLEQVKQFAEGCGGAGPGSGPAPAAVTRLDILPDFVRHVRSFADTSQLRPLRVVIDCANGMAGHSMPPVLEGLGLELIWLHRELDGSFPNHPADPLNPQNLSDLQTKVLETDADLGMAFDGDGDRVFFVDDQAEPLSGSTTLGLLAAAMLDRHPGAVVLHNVVCSRAVPEIIAERGGRAVCTKVGHSNIKAQMSATGATFGGEHSGHYYFKDNFNADSGAITALLMLELLSQGVPDRLSRLRQPHERYFASGERNLEVSDAPKILEKISRHFGDHPQERLDGLSVDVGSWWFNVRASHTEPLVRINLEANSAQRCQQQLAELLELIGS